VKRRRGEEVEMKISKISKILKMIHNTVIILIITSVKYNLPDPVRVSISPRLYLPETA
jgi:hypothetical protein